MKTVLILFTVWISAIYSPVAGQEQAEEILDKVAQNTKEMGAVKILFTYSMTNEEQGINESYEGELLSKGAKYRLKITGQEVISDGEKVWTYIPDAQEVQLNVADQGSSSFNPTSVFNDYQQKYDVSLLEKKTIKDREMAVLKLVPKNATAFKKAHLIVDLSKYELYSLSVFDEIGNKFTYQVNELLPDVGLQGGEFTFDTEAHPDVDLIDMR